MHCPNCGHEVSENQQFCSCCGIQQSNINEQKTQCYPEQIQQYVPPTPQYQQQAQRANILYSSAEEKSPRKKSVKGIIISVAVVIAVAFIGKMIGSGIIAPSMSDDDTDSSYTDKTKSDDAENQYDNKNSDNSSVAFINNEDTNGDDIQSNSENSTEVSSSVENNKYTEIFLSRNIVEASAVLIMLDSASFAKVYETDMIEKLEYGYDGDVVKELVNTIYVPTHNYTDEQKVELDTNLRDAYSKFENLQFCNINYTSANNYYIITVTFKDLESLDNVKALYDLGEIVESYDSLISMKKTEESLLSNGYVKK